MAVIGPSSVGRVSSRRVRQACMQIVEQLFLPLSLAWSVAGLRRNASPCSSENTQSAPCGCGHTFTMAPPVHHAREMIGAMSYVGQSVPPGKGAHQEAVDAV